MIKGGASAVFLVLLLILVQGVHATPPGTPAWRVHCPSTVTARFPEVTIRYECFSGESRFFFPGLTHVGLYLVPTEETALLDGEAKPYGAGDGEMSVFFSSAPDCHYGPGVTLKLSDPCLLILSQAGFAGLLPATFLASHGYSLIQGYVSGCGFKGGRPLFAVGLLPCKFGPKRDRTAGSITFSRWATRPGGHFAFRFSADARVTGFIYDKSYVKATVAVPLAGSASGVIN
ncbi:MAG: hypothetical protein ACYDCJ_01490 [Gammaproteobacteria bacterium]